MTLKKRTGLLQLGRIGGRGLETRLVLTRVWPVGWLLTQTKGTTSRDSDLSKSLWRGERSSDSALICCSNIQTVVYVASMRGSFLPLALAIFFFASIGRIPPKIHDGRISCFSAQPLPKLHSYSYDSSS